MFAFKSFKIFLLLSTTSYNKSSHVLKTTWGKQLLLLLQAQAAVRSCLGGRTLQGILRDREEVLGQIFESIKRLCAKFVEWFELEWGKDFKPITYFVWNSFAFVSSTSSLTIQFFPPKSFGRLLTVESLTQATEKLTFDHNQEWRFGFSENVENLSQPAGPSKTIRKYCFCV